MPVVARPKNFCPAPFRSMVQDFNGRFGPCPYSSGKFSYPGAPISKRWLAPAFREIRRQFLQDSPPESCNRCFAEEQSGLNSRRLQELSVDSLYFNKLARNNWEAGPETMIFRLSNYCNLACRTCSSYESSKFISEGEYYAREYGATGNPYANNHPRRQWSEFELLENMAVSGNLKRIEFYGGEPMLNKSHEGLLQALVATNRSSEVTLYYNTNASAYPDIRRIDIWKHFAEIQLTFSLDAINSLFHYIRWPSHWRDIKANLARFNSELPGKLNKPLTLASNTTISILNVYYLPEILTELNEYFAPDRIGTTVVHEPSWYNIQSLPREYKLMVEKKLSQAKYGGYYQGILSYMNLSEAPPQEFKRFLEWTRRMDSYRNLSFENYLPDFTLKDTSPMQQKPLCNLADETCHA